MSSNKKKDVAYWLKALDNLVALKEGEGISDLTRERFPASLSEASNEIKMAIWLHAQGIKCDDVVFFDSVTVQKIEVEDDN